MIDYIVLAKRNNNKKTRKHCMYMEALCRSFFFYFSLLQPTNPPRFLPPLSATIHAIATNQPPNQLINHRFPSAGSIPACTKEGTSAASHGPRPKASACAMPNLGTLRAQSGWKWMSCSNFGLVWVCAYGGKAGGGEGGGFVSMSKSQSFG